MSKCKFCGSDSIIKRGIYNFCGDDHAYQFAIKKVREKESSEQRKADRETLRRLKTRSEWLKELQVVFNRFIRLRDAALPCISCGHQNDGSRQFHASHYKSVGGNPALRFDQSNCHSACSICNNWLSGNLVPYRAALIEKIGQSEVDRLEGKQEPLKLTIDDIKLKIIEYKTKVKEIT